MKYIHFLALLVKCVYKVTVVHAPVAQLVEQDPLKVTVGDSSSSGRT